MKNLNKVEVLFGEFYTHNNRICKVCGCAFDEKTKDEIIIYCYIDNGTASDAYYCKRDYFETSGEYIPVQ